MIVRHLRNVSMLRFIESVPIVLSILFLGLDILVNGLKKIGKAIIFSLHSNLSYFVIIVARIL